MKVKVTDGYQVVDKDGKVRTSGTVDMDDVEARQAIRSGWASEAPKARKKASSKKAPAASNKKQSTSDNK